MTETVQKLKPGISQSNKQAFRNPWVLGWLAAIILVLLVNAGFIITAVMTNPGLVDKDYYEKGRDFEQEFSTLKETRHRLGWKMHLEAVQAPHTNQTARYTLSAADRTGIPVAADQVIIRAYRPSDASSDFTTEMQEVTPGIYTAELTFPLKGLWDLTAILHKGDDQLKVTRRINVQAP